MLAKTLYNCTKDIKYLNIFEMNINYNKWDSTNNLSTISALNRCVITEDLYNLFKKLYLKCEDDKADIIDEIITGMLRCKGYITIYYTFDVEKVKRQYTYINKFKRQYNMDFTSFIYILSTFNARNVYSQDK